MPLYPISGYDSFVGISEADTYFEGRLNSAEWHNAESDTQEAALLQAFRSIAELDLDIDLDQDESPLEALSHAQCEQALHELRHDVDERGVDSFKIANVLSIGFSESSHKRFSERAVAILRPYIRLKTITRTR